MQVSPVDSARLAPRLQAVALPSRGYPVPPTYHSIRLPSLAPRLPTLPSLLSTLASQSTSAGATDVSPTTTSSSIAYLLNPRACHPMHQQQQVHPSVSASEGCHSHGNTVPSTFLPRKCTQPHAPPKRKRKTRICKAEKCEKYVVDRGLCIRHGGGKRCSIEDCNCRAQNRGLCWKHGGYTRCTVAGCTKRAKSRGICWSHGGGTRCKHAGCAKIAVSHGLCWAHGGGKRCLVASCQKPAYERNGNLCAEHCAQRTPPLPLATN